MPNPASAKSRENALIRGSTDPAVLENKQTLETADYPPGEADQSSLNLYFGGKGVQLP